jgi:hypothetical protein
MTNVVRYCPECGGKIKETAKFCEHCGTNLGDINSEPVYKTHTPLCVICKPLYGKSSNEVTATCPRCSRKVCDNHFDNEIPACYICSITKYEKIYQRLEDEYNEYRRRVDDDSSNIIQGYIESIMEKQEEITNKIESMRM